MPTIIREAKSEETKKIDELSFLAFQPLRKIYRPKKNAKFPKLPLLKRLVAIQNNEFVGTVKYYKKEKGVHILGLAVHPTHQSKGIAREIIEHIKKMVKNEDQIEISLFTVKETGNVEIFEKIGFKVVHEKLDEFDESSIYENLTEVYMEQKVDKL